MQKDVSDVGNKEGTTVDVRESRADTVLRMRKERRRMEKGMVVAASLRIRPRPYVPVRLLRKQMLLAICKDGVRHAQRQRRVGGFENGVCRSPGFLHRNGTSGEVCGNRKAKRRNRGYLGGGGGRRKVAAIQNNAFFCSSGFGDMGLVFCWCCRYNFFCYDSTLLFGFRINSKRRKGKKTHPNKWKRIQEPRNAKSFRRGP
jgi:hypothetical protein